MGGGVATRLETILFQKSGKKECSRALAVGACYVDNFGGIFWIAELVQHEANTL